MQFTMFLMETILYNFTTKLFKHTAFLTVIYNVEQQSTSAIKR